MNKSVIIIKGVKSSLKGTVHPKINILIIYSSSCNSKSRLSSAENKRRYFEELVLSTQCKTVRSKTTLPSTVILYGQKKKKKKR